MFNKISTLSLANFFTLVLLFSAPQRIFADSTCEQLFRSVSNQDILINTPATKKYGFLKDNFVLDPHYKVEVIDQTDIKNQCELGTCHLHSWISMLERDYKNLNHDEIKISSHYLAISHWIRRSLNLLHSDSEDQIYVELGANVFASRNSILSYGLIPDEAWTGSRNFQTKPLSSKISEYIKNIIAKAKWEISQQSDSEKIFQIRKKYQKDILQIFENIAGKLPKKFTFRGYEYTPLSFQKTFFSELNKPITQLLVSPNRNQKTNLDQAGATYSIISANIDVVESTMRKILDSGQNVYISYEHNSQFVDSKTGVMSIGAFNLPPGAGPVPRMQRSFFKNKSNSHAAQIVGYDYDPISNKVIKWKLKNSWGVKAGDQGYYHMFNDYFRAFALSISFYSNPEFTPAIESMSPKQLEFNFAGAKFGGEGESTFRNC